VWAIKSKENKLMAVNKWVAPFLPKTIAVIKSAMIDANMTARRKAKTVLADARSIERYIKKSYAQTQEFSVDILRGLPTGLDIVYRNLKPDVMHQSDILIAQAQELAEGEDTYARIAGLYGAWSEKLGNELWERKVRAVKNTITTGITDGWSLRTSGHFVDKKNLVVSSYEATGGKGGKDNAKKGYRYIVDTPGVLGEMAKTLEPYGMAGWQIERLARTEYTRAMNDGLREIYEQSESVTQYVFDAILDSRTCVDCAMMNGVVMDIGDPRLAEYEPPIHANCRCELLPVMTWEMEESNFDKQRTVTLYDSQGSPFDVDYIASRIRPDFLHPVRPANDAEGIRRQFMSIAESDALRQSFVPAQAVPRYAAFLGISAEEALDFEESLN